MALPCEEEGEAILCTENIMNMEMWCGGRGGRHSVIRSLSRDYRKGNGELIKSFDYERAFMLY